MPATSPYRSEGGRACVDIKIAKLEQVFDNRDPAPFRERDLDPDLVEYLLDAAEDLVGHTYRIVFWLEHEHPSHDIETAVKHHFEEVIARGKRMRRRQRRVGQLALALGTVLVIALVTLGQLIGAALPGALGVGIKEGLVIASWVVLWRPVDVLIYEWIPVRRERKIVAQLLASPIEVRVGSPPFGGSR